MKLTFRCCILVFTLAIGSYAQSVTRPEFEVASVRVSNPENLQVSYMPTLDVRPGGTLRISNRRLDEIIMMAYGVGGKQISGPRWLTELTTDPTQVTRFEIVAKVPENATKDQVPLMLQKLLEDRFMLQVHREARPTEVYSLEVSRSGHKLTASRAQPSTGVQSGDKWRRRELLRCCRLLQRDHGAACAPTGDSRARLLPGRS